MDILCFSKSKTLLWLLHKYLMGWWKNMDEHRSFSDPPSNHDKLPMEAIKV